MNLVGKQKVSFTDQNTGVLIEGVKLHYTDYQENVSGMAALTKFIRTDHPLYQKALDIPLGEVEIKYGRRDSFLDLIPIN